MIHANTGTSWSEAIRERELGVEVTWHDFEHFKNRYSPDDGLAIIEVLRGHRRLTEEIVALRSQRGLVSYGMKKKKLNNPKNEQEKFILDETEPTWIERVRIESPILLRLLSRLAGHGDAWDIDIPRIFFQPFCMFPYYLPQMQECLALLDGQSASSGGGDSITGSHEPQESLSGHSSICSQHNDDHDDLTTPRNAIRGEFTSSATAVKHVRKYVNFVEEWIEPQ